VAPSTELRPPRSPFVERLRKAFPPVRLLLVALIVLGATSAYSLGGIGVASLLTLPLAAAVTDLLYQRVRFARLRVPEPALATGLFLALLLPPNVDLALAAIVAIAAVGIRHAFRFQGRPVLNPAAAGLLLGAVLFGMAPAWWAAVTPGAEYLLIALGALMVLRHPAGWRIPAVFFAAYAAFTALQHYLLGGLVAPHLLLLEVLDPAVLFFGLFMVTEPRTAPANPRHQTLYALVIALGAVLFVLPFPTLGVLLALFTGNVVAAFQRDLTGRIGTVAPAAAPPPAPKSRPSARAAVRPTAGALQRWPAGRRVASLAVVGLLLVVAVGLTQSQTSSTPSALISSRVPGGSGGGGGSSGGSGGGTGGGSSGVQATCGSDNPNIPSSTAAALHKALGPSVLLSYNSNTGVVVFYDPVNGVTVTETDLYEDYGFAEFNGDDGAVSGCSPSAA
jgi:Na+-translocating ferredoxin:NAD+ oxidoreductase RnfD subunit